MAELTLARALFIVWLVESLHKRVAIGINC
jgi:hypothetical protein